MTATASKKICPGYEPIPGYRLEKILGRGGFGEVWRADAPGGLKKAVKFVFGNHDEQRASRELKSLERIKAVNHPFILTLERFEIVDEQLVIVTELADGSLEDTFRQYRDRGSCGISRKPLLSHLHDAADALDYLHDKYQLQHLDIKPGNLLTVGGHVKVGDFGLLKDLRDVECSMIGGLTPVYAPPEVFDGRPSLHSDQYSLAVMYQELLTGTRPFCGRTIAQLASQHVHNAPDLEPLPPSDRPAMARALEKNPERRFQSCVAFVDALASSGRNSQVKGGFDSSISEGDTDPNGLAGAVVPQAVDLPSLGDGKVATQTRTATKVLVVALGGTGAETLHDMRHRIASLHSACPIDLHSVLIDTDEKAIHGAKIANKVATGNKCRTLHIPLRSSNDYRQSISDNRFASMSRRWIYNVPRSLSTEGMRPLGRLALVDHGTMVKESLQTAIQEFAGGSKSDDLAEGFKIYVVGSLCGGTGSGIYVDIVHLLRHLLDSNSLEQVQILSLLSMRGLRHDPSMSLANHDSHAALIELRHFLQPGNGYPGDKGANWPSVPAARTPLKNTYVIANNEVDASAPPPISVIGEYLWADATGAGSLLEKARQIDSTSSESPISATTIRSVGVVAVGMLRRPEEEVLVPALVKHLLLSWLGHPGKANEQCEMLVGRLCRRSGFSVAKLRNSIAQWFGGSEETRTVELAQRLQQYPENSPSDVATAVTTWVSETEKEKQESESADVDCQRLFKELFNRLTSRNTDIACGIAALTCLRTDALAEAVKTKESLNNDLVISADEGTSLQLGEKFLHHAIANLAVKRLEQFAGHVTDMIDRLEAMSSTIAISVAKVSDGRDATENPWHEMSTEISSQLEPITQQLHQLSVSKILLNSITPGSMLVDPIKLLTKLTEAASPLVGKALVASPAQSDEGNSTQTTTGAMAESKRVHGEMTAVLPKHEIPVGHDGTVALSSSLLAAASPNQESALEQPVTSMSTAIELARPPLLDFGGVQRLILSVGTHAEQVRLEAELRQYHTGALTVTVIPGTTAKLIHEAQQINLNDVIGRLSTINAGSAQVSGRLMTRTDIDWKKSEPRV